MRSRWAGSAIRSLGPLPIGVFRAVERPTYDDLLASQLTGAVEEQGPGDLESLLHAGDTWRVA